MWVGEACVNGGGSVLFFGEKKTPHKKFTSNRHRYPISRKAVLDQLLEAVLDWLLEAVLDRLSPPPRVAC